ncbi:MAG: hypothetical protein F9K31_12680 [Dokdonella sp.]|nr:MAG: hypothetical protein F9K31_12680 [Dokdonella sp.]
MRKRTSMARDLLALLGVKRHFSRAFFSQGSLDCPPYDRGHDDGKDRAVDEEKDRVDLHKTEDFHLAPFALVSRLSAERAA